MVGTKFIRRMVLLAGAFLLIGILQLLPERDFQRASNAEHLVEQTLRVLRASELLLANVEAVEAGQRGYLLTGDSRYLQPYEAALSSQGPARQNLRRLTADNGGQQARIAKLDSLVDTRITGLRRVLAIYSAQGQGAAIAAVVTNEGRREMEEIRDLLSEIEQEEYGRLHLRTKASEAQANHMRWILSTLLALVLIVGGTIGEHELRNFERVGESLRGSEERFRTLANGIPQLCWTANADGWIFWYNQRWYDFTGTTLQEMAGWGWQSVHDPEALPAVLTGWRKAIAEGEPFEMVFPLKAANGVFHPFLTRVMPVRNQAGNVVRWFGTNTDITAQRSTENALRENQESLRLAQQVAGVATYEWDLQTGAGHLTPELEAMYGVPPGGFAADHRTWQDLICPEDPERRLRYVQEVMETGNSSAEWRVTWPDGRTRWLAGNVRVFKDDNGKPLHLIGANIDVTERKLAEMEVLRMNAELEHRVQQRTLQLESVNKELEAFSYSVSHDLRAPLRGIDGWSLALLEDYAAQLDDGARQYLNRVRSETQRMGRLIDDMLQLSRVNRGEMTFHRVDLTAMANQIAAGFGDV